MPRTDGRTRTYGLTKKGVLPSDDLSRALRARAEPESRKGGDPMKPETITVPVGGDREVAVDAWPTDVDGLVVNLVPVYRPTTFALTLRRSGSALGFFTSPEAALAAGRELDGAADWTLPVADLKHQPGIIEAVRLAVATYGGHRRASRGHATGDDRNPA